MNIVKGYQFPSLTDNQLAFSIVKTNPALLQEARDRGFYNGKTIFNDLFGELFFKGGKINYREGLDQTFKDKATRYLFALMGSFEPKHEEKEAVCALILSELVAV